MDNHTAQPVRELARSEVATQLQARLNGTLTDQGLSRWAFDQFYAEELEQLAYEAGAEEIIASTLDALMFADDPTFALDSAALQELLHGLGAA